jgi:low temperature requirement protein LtrA
VSNPKRVRVQAASERATVSNLELFFDLVFVYALTQVTDLLAQNTSAVNTFRSVLVLGVLWWCWVGYSWLCNLVRADEGLIKVGMFVTMGATFVIALTIPEAFDDIPGGLSGPVMFAVGYFVVRVVHLALFWIVSREDPQLRGQLVKWIPSIVISTTLLLIASQTEGTVQTLLWLAALAGDYAGTLFAGEDWRLRSPSHFAERHGLIVIVALGESIVSIGIGVAHLPISWPIIVATMLGLTISALLWWAYFDVTSISVEHALDRADGPHQIKIARNSYTFGHFPMVVAIIGLSLGLKKVLSYVGDEHHHKLDDPLYGVPLFALYGGVVLYLLALVFFKWYAVRTVTVPRLVTAVVLIALVPLAAALPALAALGILTAVIVALISYETTKFADPREQIRHGGNE